MSDWPHAFCAAQFGVQARILLIQARSVRHSSLPRLSRTTNYFCWANGEQIPISAPKIARYYNGIKSSIAPTAFILHFATLGTLENPLGYQLTFQVDIANSGYAHERSTFSVGVYLGRFTASIMHQELCHCGNARSRCLHPPCLYRPQRVIGGDGNGMMCP